VPLTGANLRLCIGLCGTAVDATVTSNGAKATLTPTAALRGSTSYQVQLSGVTDLAGNALQLPAQLHLDLPHRPGGGAADPVTGLTLTRASPRSGSTGCSRQAAGWEDPRRAA